MNFIESIKGNWYALPLWLRQVAMEVVESIGVALAVYLYAVLDGNMQFDTSMVLIIAAKAGLKTLRAHPDIKVVDYVNDQQPS